jgi:hypothetical protein
MSALIIIVVCSGLLAYWVARTFPLLHVSIEEIAAILECDLERGRKCLLGLRTRVPSRRQFVRCGSNRWTQDDSVGTFGHSSHPPELLPRRCTARIHTLLRLPSAPRAARTSAPAHRRRPAKPGCAFACPPCFPAPRICAAKWIAMPTLQLVEIAAGLLDGRPKSGHYGALRGMDAVVALLEIPVDIEYQMTRLGRKRRHYSAGPRLNQSRVPRDRSVTGVQCRDQGFDPVPPQRQEA